MPQTGARQQPAMRTAIADEVRQHRRVRWQRGLYGCERLIDSYAAGGLGGIRQAISQ